MYLDDYGHAPRSLQERLRRLGDAFHVLGEDLKRSIAALVGRAIADAMTDAIRRLLGGEGRPNTDPIHDEGDPWDETQDRSWEDDEDSSWPTSGHAPPSASKEPTTRNRWRAAAGVALQAGLWWLRNRPRRPFLTTVAVTTVAAVTGFVAGPAFAVCVGILASAAGMLLTAQTTR